MGVRDQLTSSEEKKREEKRREKASTSALELTRGPGQLSSRGRGYLPSSLHPRTHLVQTRSPIGQRSETRTALGSGRSPG